ncbi:hypothetical protein EW026_g4161 [Hermanssonia centrifuga]|uniref:Uncharacterized protein n=1 Tax=Hermanssonia centrifuga TaxID=98765 RepID=A0A4S4KHZ9_9APHY|nr:hypothetical protein EW026_g4161 [Hermanssonia centrifuga]
MTYVLTDFGELSIYLNHAQTIRYMVVVSVTLTVTDWITCLSKEVSVSTDWFASITY